MISKTSLLFSGLASLSLLLSASTSRPNKLYVFGDSLSDTGNVFELTNAPPPPYADGRFSNGEIWVDALAADLGLTVAPYLAIASTDPATAQGINFAFGGATTGAGNTGTDALPGLQQQIDRFVSLVSPESADANALYIVWAGANDYLGGGITDPSLPVANLTNAVKTLVEQGARQVLILNLPDLGQLPATRSTDRAATLTDLTQQHNAQLAEAIAALDQQLSADVNLLTLDVNALFDQAVSGAFGFTNVTDACFDRATGSVCGDPSGYLFWDGIHPTTVAHQRLQEAALSTLQPAPTAARLPAPVIGLGVLAVGFWGARSIARQRRKAG